MYNGADSLNRAAYVVARRNNLQDTIILPCETKIDTTQSNKLPYDERARYKQ